MYTTTRTRLTAALDCLHQQARTATALLKDIEQRPNAAKKKEIRDTLREAQREQEKYALECRVIYTTAVALDKLIPNLSLDEVLLFVTIVDAGVRDDCEGKSK